MNTKYELIESSMVLVDGVTLYRIKSKIRIDRFDVNVGDLGGYIQSEKNLCSMGDAWVFGNAWVSDDARVFGNARVSGDAWVYGNASVYGNARVYGNASVYGNARVSDDARVFGNARVSGDALVYGNARVSGDAWVYGNASVSGDARVCGDARVYDNTEATKLVQTVTTYKNNITLTDAHITIGCENHTIEHWKTNIVQIGKKHGYSDDEIKHTKKLLKCLVKLQKLNT